MWCDVLLVLVTTCLASSAAGMKSIDFGLELSDDVRSKRDQFERTLSQYSSNQSYYEQVLDVDGTELRIRVDREKLKLYDDGSARRVNFNLSYTNSVPLVIFYDMDSPNEVILTNRSWCLLPPAAAANYTISVGLEAWQIGLAYIRFSLYEGERMDSLEPVCQPFNSTMDYHYHVSIASSPQLLRNTSILGFPMIVRRGKGIVQMIFRVVVVTMVTLFTFTMGCELDANLLKAYLKRPVGPVIGFFCQFVIMPVVAFLIAYFVPIRREFGFGLLTIGCSPGGGASNAWSLMLGGDLNLSILMTFISSFSALFMMPLFLFLFGRFFINVNHVQIPYGNICVQLLQISLPALAGLAFRFWKPQIAKLLTKLTRPMFIFFILFFLTFGIYSNWSIVRLLGTYPIVMPTGALLPWLGFVLAALITFLLRQPRPIVITVALETGIQNIGAAILVLLYSMPQPAGDLGAVMPIAVSIFTPVPLYFILLGLTIKRRCCDRPRIEESDKQAEDRGNFLTRKDSTDVVDSLLTRGDPATRM